jgi:hypothetical protein
VNNVSFNGGKGGATAQPTSQETLAAAEHHVSLTQQQTEHEHGASQNRELRSSFNHGRPTIAATSHAATFTGQGVVAAKGVATGPKNPVTEANPALGATPQKSFHSSGDSKVFAHLPPNGVTAGPKNEANAALGPGSPGAGHAKRPDNGSRAVAHLPPGALAGANGHPPGGPRAHQHPHDNKKPPKDQH